MCKHSIDADDSNQASTSHETASQNSGMPNVVVDMSKQGSADNLVDGNDVLPALVSDSSTETTPLVVQNSNLW